MVNVLNKPLPFKGKIPSVVTDDYQQVMKSLAGSKAKSIVIDDAGYLITNYFMKNHSSKGAGNAIFSMYNTLADNFWNLIEFIKKLPDEKICLEGMFTIVLRCVQENGKHLFITQAEGGAVSKSPMGMFEDLEIDNDLLMVDKTIREYYKEESEDK